MLIKKNLLIEWILTSWNKIDETMIKNSFIFCGYENSKNIQPSWKKSYAIKK